MFPCKEKSFSLPSEAPEPSALLCSWSSASRGTVGSLKCTSEHVAVSIGQLARKTSLIVVDLKINKKAPRVFFFGVS